MKVDSIETYVYLGDGRVVPPSPVRLETRKEVLFKVDLVLSVVVSLVCPEDQDSW